MFGGFIDGYEAVAPVSAGYHQRCCSAGGASMISSL
jgi:hypothetical protein